MEKGYAYSTFLLKPVAFLSQNTIPYQLVKPEGFDIRDDTTYTVVVCGVTEEVAREGHLTDTGILGLDAAKDYLSQFPAFSRKDIVWP